MADLFILALLGHLVGDFVLQTKVMALDKSERSLWGCWQCFLHVIVYTISVCVFMQSMNPLVWFLVFVPHFLIDKFSLASVWLKMIGGRTFESASYDHNPSDKYREFDVAFTSIVYAVVDNTFHLLSLFLLIKFVIL